MVLKNMKNIGNVIIILLIVIKTSECGLTVSKPCGQIICAEMQFCSPYGNICKPCREVCDLNSHNYHIDTCHQLCQDYLHNEQFVRRSESARDAATLAELSRDVRTLKVVAWLSMAFSGVAVLLLLALCVSKVSRARRRHGSFASMVRSTIGNFKGAQKSKEKQEKNGVVKADMSTLKLEIPALPLAQSTPTCPSTASTTVPVTPSSKTAYKQRSPSEDATLDYAYDNPGLTPSPTFVKTVTETAGRSTETNF